MLSLVFMEKDELKQIEWADFAKIEMRVGTILEAASFPEARKPAYQLSIDFGEFGIKKSSAQITKKYRPEDLVGLQIVAVINFPIKKIAHFKSECLVLGTEGDAGEITLLVPESQVPNGLRIA
jgi:tRNA-binding protein